MGGENNENERVWECERNEISKKKKKKKTKFQRVEVRWWGLKRKKKKESRERNDEPWSITWVVVKPIF